MCESVKVEMIDNLNSKTITLHSGLSNKRRRIHKPWWTVQLSELWNNVCDAEGRWHNDRMRQKLKMKMRMTPKCFDKEVQATKRHHWKSAQEELLQMCNTDKGEF